MSEREGVWTEVLICYKIFLSGITLVEPEIAGMSTSLQHNTEVLEMTQNSSYSSDNVCSCFCVNFLYEKCGQF